MSCFVFVKGCFDIQSLDCNIVIFTIGLWLIYTVKICNYYMIVVQIEKRETVDG